MTELLVENFGALSQIYQEDIYLIDTSVKKSLLEQVFDQGDLNSEVLIVYYEFGRSLKSDETEFLGKVLSAANKSIKNAAIVNGATKSISFDVLMQGKYELVIAFIQGSPLQLEYWNPNSSFEYLAKQLILLPPISYSVTNTETKKVLWHHLKEFYKL